MRLSVRTFIGAFFCLAAVLGGAGTAQAVTLRDGDLDFILQQIKRAEAHAAGGELAGPGPDQVSSPQLPFGLRTVDGTFNNIVPGQEDFGAADKLFPRLTRPALPPGRGVRPGRARPRAVERHEL